MVSHPDTGSDSPIGSDQDRGRDNCRMKKDKKLEQRLSNQLKKP